jgi:hypothetical protein
VHFECNENPLPVFPAADEEAHAYLARLRALG